MPDEPDDGLDERPTRWGMKKPDNRRNAGLESNRVLADLALGVTGGQVPERKRGCQLRLECELLGLQCEL